MPIQRIKFSVLQTKVQKRRKALLAEGYALPTDEALRNKGARRTEAKNELLRRMNEQAKAAGVEPARRYI
jgi:hypothetical protein